MPTPPSTSTAVNEGEKDPPHAPATPTFLDVLEPDEHPQHLPTWRKWLIVIVISASSLCVTCASSLAAFAENGVSTEFHVGHTVSVLSISLFVEGLGLGPLIVGPLSEVYGRNPIYRISYGLFFAFTWPVAFAPNIATFLIFRFITGFCGSAFLSVAGGSISDLFSDSTVTNPMAFYTISPFLGPVVGPFIAGFINQHLNWRWTYYLVIIWSFGQFIALFFLVPETYVPVLQKAKARRFQLAGDVGEQKTQNDGIGVLRAIIVSCYTPFKLLLLDRMALLLDIWTSLILGILYLAFQAYPIIFQGGHGFNLQDTGLGFLGIGVGMVLGLLTQPYWNRFYKRTSVENGGVLPPEARLYMGQVGAICVPVGLFWLAFTTYPAVPWIVPVLASVPFGCGIYFVFTSTFTYLVTTYRPIAASAMAANSAMRSTFAAVFPLFAGAMYAKLGTVGATALLAGLTTLMAPLPFVFTRIGPRLRRQSRFAV
ncbi:MFS general substrate transporter [Macrolepiota fuliginosa MF-IS2]|uniref:MFS general substrate transporter n=1 Tax=Macrolepiota fuliginosa MF-IS2 TaxID=1400762 RepID=A0A9P5X9E7_9AGAR|nr:MFS general substrate transporter [Macrolepiota fuliginosa MF-IS2]